MPDRFAEYEASFKTWAARADDIYDASAAKTGGSRHIRLVTAAAAGYSIVVQRVTISPAGDDSVATRSTRWPPKVSSGPTASA